MTTNTKTPAMLLQEYTVKKKISAPEYDLIVSNCGTHENEFVYKVKVAGIEAEGKGRSKQVAKHSAAFQALEKLRAMGDNDLKGPPASGFQPSLHRNEPDNPNERSVNSIGCLQDCCSENKIPQPIFHEVSDVGPSHCRQFTYECEIDSIKTQATAKTKKQAKQLSAKLMLEKIKEMIPDLVSANAPLDNCLMDKDDEALNEYHRNHSLKVIMNKSAKVCDFPNCFGILMNKMGVTPEDFCELLKLSDEETLIKVLEKLELKHSFIQIQGPPCAVNVLTVNIDTPFAVMGVGDTEEKAKHFALKNAFSTLKAYFNGADLVN